MEGQGKRLLLAVVLALGVLLLWNVIFPSKKDDAPQPQTTGSGAVIEPLKPVSPLDHVPKAARQAESTCRAKIEELAFPNFTAKFSSCGGALVSWKLADPRFQQDESKGEVIVPAGKLTGFPHAGSFLVGFWSGADEYLSPYAEWQGTKVSPTEVRYALSTPKLDLAKTFTIIPDAFLVRATITVTVKSGGGQTKSYQLAVRTFSYQDPDTKEESSRQVSARLFESSTLRDGSIYQTPWKDVLTQPRWEPNITWSGFEHPYILAGLAPKSPGVEKHTYADKSGAMWTDLVFQPAPFVDGGSTSQEIVAYFGPKNYDDLDRADGTAGFSTGFKDTIDLGWFAFIGRPLLWLLQRFFSVVGNWGVAIILLTFLVKALTMYWTTKSMRSMKAMASLAPQIKLINEKYAEDRQRIQAETMALYKQHNVNPIAGCLPILLQMPIWIALYRMLSSAGELYAQPFIPGWIDDLTLTDPFHILPIVLVITMFMQARLTPQTGDSRQQKFLQYGMPLMFGFMSFFFPAGLTLYIFTNTCLSALHSIYMNKYDKKSLAIAATLKKNQEAAAAAAAALAAKKNPTKGGKPVAAKPVIVTTAEERETGDDNDGDDDGSPETPSGSTNPGTGPSKARPRRKKRRR